MLLRSFQSPQLRQQNWLLFWNCKCFVSGLFPLSDKYRARHSSREIFLPSCPFNAFYSTKAAEVCVFGKMSPVLTQGAVEVSFETIQTELLNWQSVSMQCSAVYKKPLAAWANVVRAASTVSASVDVCLLTKKKKRKINYNYILFT